MMWWCAGLAFGAEPVEIVDDGTLVRRVVEATPVQLAADHPYRHGAATRAVRRGWVVVLEVAPEMLVPRQIGEPVLWVGGHPAMRLRADVASGCTAVFVPGTASPSSSPVFFGGTQLAETLSDDDRVRQRRAAEDKGIGPVDWTTAVRPLRSFDDFRGVHAWAQGLTCAD